MHPNIPRTTPLAPDVERLASEHDRDPEALLPILQGLDRHRGGLDRLALTDVARVLKIPPARARGVASFYAMLSTTPQPKRMIRVCDGVACWLNGGDRCRATLETRLADDPDWTVTRSSCLGLCDRAPAAFVEGRQCGPLAPETVADLGSGWSGPPPMDREPRPGEERLVLARMGRIDPRSLDEALDAGAYRGLQRALQRPPEQVIAEIEKAGLRGRGGAGFPTGRKWRLVAESPGPIRYVIGNADESEPLTFKDRVLMESDPHALLEGLALAAYAVGAQEGIVYIRGEYEPQAALLEHAIRQATDRGWLGERIGGTHFAFHLRVHRGAGAYICGEETALLESLEGRRGEPRIRPPYPAAAGYRGKPTVINNVETLATAAVILRLGADAYRSFGTPEQPGTRLCTLLGHLQRPGIIEVPFGLTVRALIERFGGGMRPGSRFHCALTGGTAGTLVSVRHLDVPLDDSSAAAGVAMGAGGMLICDQSVSPVRLLRELMHFFEVESCGKCTPCRIGTSEARRRLDDLLAGNGTTEDIARLRHLAMVLKSASFCGLGTSAADPVNSALDHFGEEFEKLVS